MKNLLTLYLILSAFVSFAQNETNDSLQQALKNFNAQKRELGQNILPDESDTTKVNILNGLSREFMMVANYAAARKHADEALAIAQQIGFKKGIAKSYDNIGKIYYSQGNFSEALKNLIAASKEEEPGNKNGIAASYGNIGIVYWSQGNYPEALKNLFASLKIFEETGDKQGTANSYNNIGLVYWNQGNHSEALKNYFAALKIYEETGDKQGTVHSYNNIGLIYKAQGKYTEALKSYSVSLKIQDEIGDKRALGIIYGNIGNIYDEQGNYPEALKNHFASLKILEEIGEKDGISKSYGNIGNIKVKTKMALEGKNLLMKGLMLAKEIGAVESIKSIYEGLAVADSALGNFKGAYENHKLFVLYRDSLNNEETTKKSLQTKMQYEFDKKETETKALTDAELKKQKLVRNGFVGGFAVVLLFAGVFFRQRNKTKKEKKRSEDLLLNILPAEVADEIKTTGTAKAKAFTMVTVMFTDFKDFTTVSEKVSAELLVDEIHTCFSAFDHILQKHKIEKIKPLVMPTSVQADCP